jgi:formylglycine-generating enzyme required for sulfatase activity
MRRVWALVVGAACAVLSAVPAARAAEAPAPFRDCDACPEMQLLPAGEILMGARGGDPRHAPQVAIKIARPFAIARFEVTREQFREFVRDAEFETGTGCQTWNEERTRFAVDHNRGWANPGRPREPRDDHPVACVSWTEAAAYAAWLAKKTERPYRLPSEAEWEYAARAGSARRFPWGENPDDACQYANLYDESTREIYPLGEQPALCRDGFADLAPVGALRPNAFGLFDMIGNVAEWVEDCYTASSVGRPHDGRAWVWTGGCPRRVQRGGSWLSPPTAADSTARVGAPMNERSDWVGFRVARDANPPAGSR